MIPARAKSLSKKVLTQVRLSSQFQLRLASGVTVARRIDLPSIGSVLPERQDAHIVRLRRLTVYPSTEHSEWHPKTLHNSSSAEQHRRYTGCRAFLTISDSSPSNFIITLSAHYALHPDVLLGRGFIVNGLRAISSSAPSGSDSDNGGLEEVHIATSFTQVTETYSSISSYFVETSQTLYSQTTTIQEAAYTLTQFQERLYTAVEAILVATARWTDGHCEKQSKPLSSPGSLSYNTWCRLFSNGTREDISPILDVALGVAYASGVDIDHIVSGAVKQANINPTILSSVHIQTSSFTQISKSVTSQTGFANATAPVGLRFPKRLGEVLRAQNTTSNMSVIVMVSTACPSTAIITTRLYLLKVASARTMYRLFASFGSKACQSYHTDSSRTQSAHRWQFQLDSACGSGARPVDGSDNHGPAWDRKHHRPTTPITAVPIHSEVAVPTRLSLLAAPSPVDGSDNRGPAWDRKPVNPTTPIAAAPIHLQVKVPSRLSLLTTIVSRLEVVHLRFLRRRPETPSQGTNFLETGIISLIYLPPTESLHRLARLGTLFIPHSQMKHLEAERAHQSEMESRE
ncbi:hypothetical protein H4Q26_007830 [Puccinia striiformis f. sp. tritici PST-130]|nr:hypothetical protein H4Q26_007830 [Puccinia striiformis f. sp. tritici PST-130]